MSLLDPNIWLSLATLTFLEIILGVDNLVFISIISSEVEHKHQKLTRRIGLLGALVLRLIFLAGVVWIIGLTKPLFSMLSHTFSIRDLILIGGGLFLLVKGTLEIHHVIEVEEEEHIKRRKKNMWAATAQIMMFDIIFSLDSILTAIGLTHHYWIMATAIIIAIIVMIMATEVLHRFISNHPTVKILALSFLLLIGLVLLADGFHVDIPREYVYFAIAFSIFVEFINSLLRRSYKRKRNKELQ